MGARAGNHDGGNGTGKPEPSDTDSSTAAVAAAPVSWDEIEEFAFGELNLSPEAFDELTPNAYYKMVRGYYRRLEDQAWEPLRWLGTLFVNMHRGENDAPYEPAEILPLRKDPPVVAPAPFTAAEQAAIIAELDELDADLIIK